MPGNNATLQKSSHRKFPSTNRKYSQNANSGSFTPSPMVLSAFHMSIKEDKAFCLDRVKFQYVN